ncbi:MAG: hypothetical protein QOD72_1266 [Acidimicrobiaceae bacterium]|jgi:hypothetical protein|nr:hypothetical protein [Acidimicrobiaceae bacterium]
MKADCIDRAESDELLVVRNKIRQLLVLRPDWSFQYAFLYAELLLRETRLLSSFPLCPPATPAEHPVRN